ncbi:MAG: hypothetical protein M3362_11335 [Acidobacteriota bacterium]|nr:hypothetical protein [Acidobacteriota bacterium]
MKIRPYSVSRLFAVVTLVLFSAAFAVADAYQDKSKPAQAPEAERKAAQKINDAKDPAAKLTAAGEFINKYPKSTLRPKIAEFITNMIADTKDVAQRITLAESFINTFTEASEANRMYPILIDAYLSAKRVDNAFDAAAPWLELNPNEVDVLYQLAVTGADEARRQNTKYAKQSQQYGLKAIELIEADKRPEGISVENWNKNKAVWLPQLYQSMGFLSILSGNTEDALAKLQKAMTLNPNDPFNYVLVGSIKNNQYLAAANQVRAMPAGAARTDAEKKLMTQLDEIIDLFAHAIGLMEGKPQYQAMHDQLLPDTTNYYKFRHNNSTAGLQDLINKYKQP